MEYVIGPVISLLIALGYVKKTTDDQKNETYTALEKIEEVESRLTSCTIKVEEESERITTLASKVEGVNEDVLRKSLKIITPLAQATQRLQDAVGVK